MSRVRFVVLSEVAVRYDYQLCILVIAVLRSPSYEIACLFRKSWESVVIMPIGMLVGATWIHPRTTAPLLLHGHSRWALVRLCELWRVALSTVLESPLRSVSPGSHSFSGLPIDFFISIPFLYEPEVNIALFIFPEHHYV